MSTGIDMKVIYLLTVMFYLPDGSFIDGNQVDGWSPRPHDTLAQCQHHAEYLLDQGFPSWAKGWVVGCREAPADWNKR